MSVLGYNSIGGTQRNSIGYAYSCKFTPTEDGTIDDIVVYADILNGSRDLTVAIFSDNAGTPDTLLAYGTTQTGLTASGWYTFSGLTEVVAGNLDITNGTPIHLAAWVNENGTNVKWRYDAGASGQAHYLINLGGGAFDTWADVSSAGGPESDNMSIYANYTAAGGAVNVDTGLGAINYSGLSPVISVSDNKNAQTDLGLIAYNGLAPTVSVSNNVNISTELGQVLYSGLVPTVLTPVNISTQVGAIAYDGFTSVVSISDNINIQTDLGQIVYSGFPPSIQIGNNININTDLGAIIYNGFNPTVLVSNNINIATGLGLITYTGYRPSVSTSPEIPKTAYTINFTFVKAQNTINYTFNKETQTIDYTFVKTNNSVDF